VAKQASASSPSFESEFDRLGKIVEQLEGGNIALEEMLGLYEEGMKLAEKLNAILQQAELRVQKLAQTHEEGVRA
jgi:exodeoxyribonuclease VII small subunit